MIKTVTLTIGVCVLCNIFGSSALADIIDFNDWSLVEDPPHPNFAATVNSATQATLSATAGSVPHATDIGFKSISGYTPATSTSGYAFSPSADFSVAIDFRLTFSSPVGGLGIGFGIGEDSDGMNSAGAVLFTVDGIPVPVFGAAARTDDFNQTPLIIKTPLGVPVAGQTTGRLISSYAAVSGNIVLGVSTNGDDSPEGVATYAGIQNNWDGGLLFPSFFLRSDSTLGTAWTSGTADAVFSNFHVISGSPVSLVPEPSSLLLFVLGAACLMIRRRKPGTARFGSRAI